VSDLYIVIGRDDCKWCDEAVMLLCQQQVNFDYYDAQDLDSLMESFGFKTVPQVFHGTKYIGGFTDLRRYIEKDFS
jgi:glutaredoxin 1